MEAAEGGTLFLDEIGNLGMDIQAKLLKVVEEKVVRRLSELQDRKINVKIIAATNRDLDAARAKREFREDLYHRLNVVRIDLPPLRERGNDILILADFFLDKYVKKYNKPIKGFTAETREAMLSYHWPGNVRELNNIIERAVLLENVDYLDSERLGLNKMTQKTRQLGQLPYLAVGGGAPEAGTESESIHLHLPPEGVILDEVEKSLIEQALERTRWNRSKAAKLLGISLDTLRYRIEKYGLGR